MIMMRPMTPWRARSGISERALIVVDLCPDPLPRSDRARGSRNVIGAPMAEGTSRRVRIIDHERKTLRPGRRFAPFERRRLVGSVAAKLRWDWLTVLERVAGEN